MASEITTHAEFLADMDREPERPMVWTPSVRFLKMAILVLMAGGAFAIISLQLIAPDQHVRAMAPLAVCLIAAIGWVLLARRHIRATVYLLPLGCWVVITGTVAFTGGVQAPAVVAYPIIIAMVGWMINARVAIVVTTLTILSTLGFLWAGGSGLLPAPTPSAPALYAGDQLIIYLVCAGLVLFLVRSYQDRLHDLRRIAGDLARRTRDVEATQAELHRAEVVSNVGSWVYDIGADTIRLSSHTAHIFGFPEGVVGNHDAYLAWVHPDDRQAADLGWQAALRGEGFDQEHRIVVRGAVRWIRQRAELSFGPDGKAIRAVGVTQDVTDRKNAQSALEDSEERYRTMTEWSPDAILVHRMGVVLYVNAAAVRLFAAATAADLVGKLTPALIHPDFRPQQPPGMEPTNSSAVIKPVVQSKFLRLDGRTIDVEVLGTAIVYDGEPAVHVSIRDITERKKSEEKINELAFYDQLTGLPNRTFLLERLKQSMAASARSLNHGALLFIDLDDFKKLNDTLGHDMGDVLLKQVSQRLAACVRAEDTVGRLGGDEFVVLLENLALNDSEAAQQAEVAGEKIRVVLGQPYQLGNAPYHSTPSMGATVFMGQGVTVDNLLKQADLAMYKSKAAGRNALRFFNVEMERSVMTRAALERDLRAAVRGQQFFLHYQPQVKGDGVVIAAEVLVRWQHPQRGLVSPADFIPLAEDTGLIVPLGAWILEAACTQLARWADHPALAHLTISVNVSARQFQQSNFVSEVMSILDRTGARPDRLRLELTESLLVAQIEDLIEKMRLLKSCGVGFSLDDFGTGYSSLSYLSQLPLDELKIDRSFVMGIESRDDAVVICAATISLAHSLKLKVVAEGVETEAQRYFLQTVHRCDSLQGYLFSRPVPLQAFEELVLRA